MERPVHRLYVATFDLRRVVWELYAVISKSGRGKYSFKQHSLNLDIEVKCAFDFPRLISSADDGIYSH